MLLAVDIGNTNIVIGAFRDSKLIADWRITTKPYRTTDEYATIISNLFDLRGIKGTKITDGIISCVVPPLTHVISEYLSEYLRIKPLIVGPGIKTGMPILYENPKEVGADRIVNAVAGIEKYGTPLIVVDFGTATTFDAISKKGEYLGGAIAPGIGISLDALFSKASRLPRVDLVQPPSVIGKDTVSSIQSGALYGFASLVDGIIEKMVKELEGEVKIIATGGLSAQIATASKYLKIIDNLLTLDGLRIIFERNS